jgi:protein-tyrosine phosphatase
MVVSVLSNTEFPEEIAKSCAHYGLKHWVINLNKADEETMEDEDKMEQLILELKELYKFFQSNNEKVLLHCMSGIQRTGICLYTLLRWTGLDSKTCFDVMFKVREETAIGMGEWRFRLAELDIVAQS